jgi:hypothetical protein
MSEHIRIVFHPTNDVMVFKTLLRLFLGCRSEQQTIDLGKVGTVSPEDDVPSLNVDTYVYEGGKMNEPFCPICFEVWMYGTMISHTGCGHTYHTICLNKWFDKRINCPNCRTDLLN